MMTATVETGDIFRVPALVRRDPACDPACDPASGPVPRR